MFKNLAGSSNLKSGLLCLLAMSGLLMASTNVHANLPVVGIYFTTPSNVSLRDHTHRSIMEDVNDRVLGKMAGFFTRNKIASPLKINQDELEISADIQKIEIDKMSLESRFSLKENEKSYFSAKNIKYVLVGKYEHRHTEDYSIHWNIVKVDLSSPVKFQARQQARNNSSLDIKQYIDNDKYGDDLVKSIYSSLLSYIDRSHSNLARTNVVFCSCFGITSSKEARERLSDVVEFFPKFLARQLKEKMKDTNLKFIKPRDLIKKEACNQINTEELRQIVTITVSPDYFISGTIQNKNNDDVTVHTGIDRPRSESSFSSFDVTSATKKKHNIKGLAEEVAIIIRDEWLDMKKELHSD